MPICGILRVILAGFMCWEYTDKESTSNDTRNSPGFFTLWPLRSMQKLDVLNSEITFLAHSYSISAHGRARRQWALEYRQPTTYFRSKTQRCLSCLASFCLVSLDLFVVILCRFVVVLPLSSIVVRLFVSSSSCFNCFAGILVCF